MRDDEEFDLGEKAEKAWRHGHRGGPRGRGRGFGGPGGGFGGPWMGGFGPWPGDPRSMRGPRVKRGDVRAAVLALLAEGPRNGYQIIQDIGERSGGVWQPSPGSVYPALQQLEDEGLIAAETPEGGRKQYVLTAEGRDYMATHSTETPAPWDSVAGSVGSGAMELRGLVGQVAVAAMQVHRVGGDAQVAQAHRVLADARRSLYRILAADEDEVADA
ncbi:MAG TPA: PadR family transcriptional regulator [Streptosporangiaceae bacterium]|nr:PadR family transcriptional regulator [Streptosporangiaceae bacterium]